MNTLGKPSRTQDEWLALRCQAGEQTAFEDLVAMMERPLLYYATKLTGDGETALDVLQDVWIKAFRGIGRLKDPSSLRPWLYRITHGMVVDRIRRYVSAEKAEEAHVAGLNESDDLCFTQDDTAAIHEALSELGPKHREVLVLYFLEDFSVAEIAIIVGCSEIFVVAVAGPFLWMAGRHIQHASRKLVPRLGMLLGPFWRD